MTNLVTDIDENRYDAVIRCSTNSNLNDMDKSTTALIVPTSTGGDDILPYPSRCHATNVEKQNKRIREANEDRVRNRYDVFYYKPTRIEIYDAVKNALTTSTNIPVNQRSRYVISTITDLKVLDIYANTYEVIRSESADGGELYVDCTYHGKNETHLKLNTNMAQASLFYANYMPMTLTTIYNPEVELTSKYYIILEPNGTGICHCEIDSDDMVWEVDLIPINPDDSSAGYSLPTVLGSAPTLDAAIYLSYVYSLQYDNEELHTHYTPMVVTRRTLIDLIYKYNTLTNSSMLTSAYPIYQASSKLLRRNAKVTVLHYGDNVNTHIGHSEYIDINSPRMISPQTVVDHIGANGLKSMQLPELMLVLKGVLNSISVEGREIYISGYDGHKLIDLADVGCFDLGDNAYILYRLGLITMFGFDKQDPLIKHALDMYMYPEDYKYKYRDIDDVYDRYTDADHFMSDYQYDFTLREHIYGNRYISKSELYEGVMIDYNVISTDPLSINGNDILVLSNLRMLMIYYLYRIINARYTDSYGADIINDYNHIEDGNLYVYDVTAVKMLLKELKRRLIASYATEHIIDTIPNVPTTDIGVFRDDQSLSDLIFRRNALFNMSITNSILTTINRISTDDTLYNTVVRCAFNIARPYIQPPSIDNTNTYAIYHNLCNLYGDMPYVRELVILIDTLRYCCDDRCNGKPSFTALVIIRLMLTTGKVPSRFEVYREMSRIRYAVLN